MSSSTRPVDPSADGSARRLLRSHRLFDGADFVAVPSVLVDGSRIAAIGSDAEARADGDPTVDVVELGDVSMMPGLVDCHQHLVFDGLGTLEDQVGGLTDDELVDRAVRMHDGRCEVA